jgi:hypothetical protein
LQPDFTGLTEQGIEASSTKPNAEQSEPIPHPFHQEGNTGARRSKWTIYFIEAGKRKGASCDCQSLISLTCCIKKMGTTHNQLAETHHAVVQDSVLMERQSRF